MILLGSLWHGWESLNNEGMRSRVTLLSNSRISSFFCHNVSDVKKFQMMRCELGPLTRSWIFPRLPQSGTLWQGCGLFVKDRLLPDVSLLLPDQRRSWHPPRTIANDEQNKISSHWYPDPLCGFWPRSVKQTGWMSCTEVYQSMPADRQGLQATRFRSLFQIGQGCGVLQILSPESFGKIRISFSFHRSLLTRQLTDRSTGVSKPYDLFL